MRKNIQSQAGRRALLLVTAILGGAPGVLMAQGSGSSFSGFTQGNLVVTRSVYTGDATTITKGQFLPPICPAGAACSKNGAPAVSNGAYPSAGSASNVWNNNSVDGSFGITSPIFIDQITPQGNLVNTLAVPPGMMVTSFSSKSELAVNQSVDGTAITMMGYIAPANAIDVSNSNTPGAYDPTNPAGGSYFRGVLEVAPNGAMKVTPTNAYSGNNGRAAILANGLYYMVGNANNGSGTPANIIATAGVQVATPGQPATTPAQEVGNFSITAVNNPATGQPYPADKAGKDNNFRGLTIFGNTMYVTKGSGGNGINTVYQVGTAGSPPTLANAATAPITVLPGFNTVGAKTATTGPNPFGIWFANATTLYVADEGDGATADAATSKYAGLEKWTLVNGTWQLDYVLQNGLNLGVPYSVPNYPASLNPATDGLRNITGQANPDGTVTIWGITSTVSANGDQGADPNQLVMINDNLANTTAAGAASEAFTVLMTAPAGQVLRGVGRAPHSTTIPTSQPVIGSAATPSLQVVAPGSLAAAYGPGMASGDPGPILGVLPDYFGGTTVSIKDSTGTTTQAPLFYVSPTEVNFQVPSTVATGTAQVSVTSADGALTETAGSVQIASVAPGLFTLGNSGLAAAYATRVTNSGQTAATELPYQVSSNGTFVPAPINMGSGSDVVYLTLYGTGFDNATKANTTVTVNGVNANVLYAGSQMEYTGLDQLNIQLPASLAGSGNVNIQATFGTTPANGVQITIQ